jgi:PKHD-type hydroxylase
MTYYYTRKILDESQIKKIQYLLDIANKNNSWENGTVSLSKYNKKLKNNFEINDYAISQEINSIIMHCLDLDHKFIGFTSACETGQNIISKFTAGSYYNTHIDSWESGDYSTTIFLSDPKTYDGGELCLKLDHSGEELKFKLPIGHGITYPTGIFHRVNEITSGVRYASVFWTKSLIKDEFMRFIYGQMYDIVDILSKKSKIQNIFSNKEFNEISFIVDSMRHQILRKYANK